ncbi:MAG: enoyl-CoA hydratase/isomerase family protein [Hyphomicrobiaceae bacterium]
MPLLVSQTEPHIVQVTIDNQAKRNAMPRQMLAELADLWDKLAADHQCRAVIVTGAGDKAFCAGADIGGDLTASEETATMINKALLKTHVFPKPVIAAVNGVCAGGGVELLLATDMRCAADHARFGLPEVRFAIYPFGGAAIKLIQQIGHVHAMDLILTGRLVDAADACRLGLVNEVVAADKVQDWALAKARMIAQNSPTAVQAVKTQIASTISDHARSREAMEQELGDRVRASADFKEGVAAFLEKRTPNY